MSSLDVFLPVGIIPIKSVPAFLDLFARWTEIYNQLYTMKDIVPSTSTQPLGTPVTETIVMNGPYNFLCQACWSKTGSSRASAGIGIMRINLRVGTWVLCSV